MKRTVNIFTAALALLAFVACNKEQSIDEAPVAKIITIKATLADAATRVTFDPAYGSDFKPTRMAHTWEAGDQLLISDSSDPSISAIFTLVDGEGTVTGTFEGEEFAAASYDIEVIPQDSVNDSSYQTQEKDGSTNHLGFIASATGVTDLSSFSLTESSGIIGIIAKLPKGVAATVYELAIYMSLDHFDSSDVMCISLNTQEDVDEDDLLKIYANVPSDWSIEAGAELIFEFKSTNPDHYYYSRYLALDEGLVPESGKFNYLKLNCSHIDTDAGNGSGTALDPYLVADSYQMLAIHDLLKPDQVTYFKLVTDIDMSYFTWIPLNNVADDNGHYSKYINFEGNNHILWNIETDADDIPPYPSVFGVLNGSVSNLTISFATITPGDKKSGVLAGYIGSQDSAVIPSVTNVHIIDSSVGTANKRGTNIVGGLAAQIQKDGTTISNVSVENTGVFGNTSENKSAGGLIGYIRSSATLEDCHTDALVSARAYLGGIVGQLDVPSGKNGLITRCYFDGQSLTATYRYAGGIVGHTNGEGTLTIQDCYVTSNVKASSGWAGGISGNHYKGTTQIYNCYVTGEVIASFGAGGIVGQVNADNLDIQKCAAFNRAIAATVTDDQQHYSSGAIVAYAKGKLMTINMCYHKAGMTFTECPGNAGNTLPTSNSGISWLNNEAVSEGAHQYIYPYHGRRTQMTLVDLTRDTYGWDSNVWDFSGELPTLK